MNCPDCDSPLYNDGQSCKCGWTLKPAEKKGDAVPVSMKQCAYCERKPGGHFVNGWPCCGAHFQLALYHVSPDEHKRQNP